MGASFRNIEQIKALAGCDRLTISPKLLAELASDTSTVKRAMSPTGNVPSASTVTSEAAFRWYLNQNGMATEKLAEGIRNFNADHRKLLHLLAEKM